MTTAATETTQPTATETPLLFPRSMTGLTACFAELQTLFRVLRTVDGFNIESPDKNMLGQFASYAGRRFDEVEAGANPEDPKIGRTIAFGVRLIVALEERFDEFADESYVGFVAEMKGIHDMAPAVFNKRFDEVAAAQKALREVIDSEEADVAEVAQAIVSLKLLLRQVTAEAVEDKRERDERRARKRAANATAILEGRALLARVQELVGV